MSDDTSESIAIQRDLIARMKEDGWNTIMDLVHPVLGPIKMTVRDVFDAHALNLWIVTETAVRLGERQDMVMDLVDYEAHWNFLLRDQQKRLADDLRRWT